MSISTRIAIPVLALALLASGCGPRGDTNSTTSSADGPVAEAPAAGGSAGGGPAGGGPAGGSAAGGPAAGGGPAGGSAAGGPAAGGGPAGGSAAGGGPAGGSAGGSAAGGGPAGGSAGGSAAGGTTAGGTAGAGCKGGATDTGVTPDSVSVGQLISQTGAVGATIAPFKTGYDAWIKSWNATGGTCGRKIITATADTQGNSGQNAQLARQLVSGTKVFSIMEADPLGASGSASYLQDEGVPVLFGDSANNVWFDTPVMFPLGNQYSGLELMAEWAVEKRRATKFAVMWINVQVDVEGCTKAVNTLKKLGHTPVYTANIPVGAPDLSTYVTQARQAGADGLLDCVDTSTGVALAKALSKQNWRPYHATGSGSTDDSLLSAVPASDIEGLELHSPMGGWRGGTLGITAYKKAMTAAYGPNHKNSVWTVRGFVSAWLFTTALEQLGATVTRKGLMDWLNRQNAATISKINPGLGAMLPRDTTWVPDNAGRHTESRCNTVLKVTKGDIVEISDGWYCK